MEQEISEILQSMLQKMLAKARAHAEGGELFRVVDASSPNGIYEYDRERDAWVKLKVDELKLDRDGIYVIYFDNTRCPACRRYDPVWFTFVSRFSKEDRDTRFFIVLCDWFARQCRAEEAAKTFRRFDIHASPTTTLLLVKRGEIVDRDDIEGYVDFEKLVMRYLMFRARAKISDKDAVHH